MSYIIWIVGRTSVVAAYFHTAGLSDSWSDSCDFS